MSETVLQVEHVSKQYRRGQLGLTTFKEDLDALAGRILGRKNKSIGTAKGAETFYALEDVSFEIGKGSATALVGRNGAGKSTLLKLISRITSPTSGTIRYKGHVASLLEVGTGFNQQLTGRENIYLNGAIMGLSRADITKRLDEIIEFSEISDFIDTPVKRYSSGMYVKLGFAVAAHLDPDILICDEVLAVGDTRFQQKCIDKMSELAGEHTVIYVSHNMQTLRQLCTSAIYLEDGHLLYTGELEHAISLYAGASKLHDTMRDYTDFKHEGNMGKLADIQALEIVDALSCEFAMNSSMHLRIKLHASLDVKNARIALQLSKAGSGFVATALSDPLFTAKAGETQWITLNQSLGGLGAGEYEVRLWLCFIDPIGRMVSYDVVPNAFAFAVTQNQLFNSGMLWSEKVHGVVRLPDPEFVSVEALTIT